MERIVLRNKTLGKDEKSSHVFFDVAIFSKKHLQEFFHE